MIWNLKRYGQPTNPPLVFLHGMGGTGKLWRPIAANLENDFDVICPDQRGHGGSRPVPLEDQRWSPLSFARDLQETFQSIEMGDAWDRRPWLIGHSMGVRVALGYAKFYPQDISGLLLVDLGFSGLSGGGLGDRLGSFISLLPTRFTSQDEARKFLTKENSPDPSIGLYLLAVMNPDGTFPFEKEDLLGILAEAKNSDTRHWLEEFARTQTQRKVLCLRGEKSVVYSAEEMARDQEYFKPYPNILFESLKGATHGLPFEKRLEFVQRIRELARG